MQSTDPVKRSEALGLISKLRKNVQVCGLCMYHLCVAGSNQLPLQAHSFTESQILDAIYKYPDLIAWLYEQFAARHKVRRLVACLTY
jgi:ribosomal protein L20A (L18A)